MMPSWDIHKRWDSKFGIPLKVSDYIVKAIDSKGPFDKAIPMPQDFSKHTLERKIPRSGGKDFAIGDIYANLHDRARSGFVQKEDLKFLLKKGEEYVRAYYLHFMLDYLNHQSIREWMNVTGDSIEDCIDKYERNKAVYIPKTQEALTEVMDFLKSHAQEVKQDLNL